MRRTRITAPIGAALVALAVAVPIALDSAEAGKSRVLGAASPARPTCPQNCTVEASVTGFQTAIKGRKRPFVVPSVGRIIAWSIKLGKPTKTDRRFFNREFGGAKARLSILKPIRGKKKGKLRYRLRRQGPLVKLAPFFGEIATFSLPRALNVRKGNIVALTIPTWAPTFAERQGAISRWQASRVPKKGGCFAGKDSANVNAGAAHTKRGSERPYRCRYLGSRLLYSARFVALRDKG
jgi:hypothetical protein